MSNVKDIKIVGDLDTLGIAEATCESVDSDLALEFLEKGHNIAKADVPAAQKAAKMITRFLAQSTFPHFGLKIQFGGESREEKNGYKGQITYFNYEITGQEAVSYDYLQNLVAALEVFGKVDVRAIRDLEL